MEGTLTPDDLPPSPKSAVVLGNEHSGASSAALGRADGTYRVGELPGLSKLLQRLGVEEESPGVAASALEFALEGLHLSRRLNKDLESRAGASRYRSAEPDA